MRIAAVTHAVPSAVITNRDLVDVMLARSPALSPAQQHVAATLLEERLASCGAVRRFHRREGERAIDFTIAAARAALSNSGLAPDNIDLLVFVGVGRGFIEPATAGILQSALGLTRATCFDVLDACASWLRGVEIAHMYMRAGRVRHAMVVNCEFNFREYVRLDFESPEALDRDWAGFTIGEAATATIISADDDAAFYSRFATSGDYSDLCSIPLPHAQQFVTPDYRDGHHALRFRSDAKRLHFHGIQLLATHFMADEQARRFPYDIIFGHSVGVPASHAVADRLELDVRRHFEIFPECGNTVSASLPLAMSLALDAGRLQRGDRVLLLVASAGITTGYATLTF
jgi:3-oxoacyl-[acyl-carrier-protein] synthase III